MNNNEIKINIPDGSEWYMILEGDGMEFTFVAMYPNKHQALKHVDINQTVRGPIDNIRITEIFVNDEIDKPTD